MMHLIGQTAVVAKQSSKTLQIAKKVVIKSMMQIMQNILRINAQKMKTSFNTLD